MRHAIPMPVVLVLFTIAVAGMATDEAKPKQLVLFGQNGKYGFKDAADRIVIEPVYDDAKDFACGLAAVNVGAKRDYTVFPSAMSGGKWGYIDEKGQMVIPPSFAWACAFSEDLALVSEDGGLCYVDTKGQTVIRLTGIVSAGNFSEGVAPVQFWPSDKKALQTRFINKTGGTVFTVEGDADEFHEGLAALSVRDQGDGEDRKCGYIDHTGKVVISPRFAEAYPFSEGLAPVRTKKTGPWYGKGDTWGYIDKAGTYALKPQYNEAGPFYHGVARVHVGGTLREYEVHSPPHWEGGEWQLIDKTGKVLKRSPKWMANEEAPTESLSATP